jgi:glucose-6-phosphate isomerase
VIFAGQNICEDYLAELLELLDGRNYSIVVISKSGTTTEPAIAFRILKDHLERKVGKTAAARKNYRYYR